MNQAYRILPLRKMTKPTLDYFTKLTPFTVKKMDYYPPRLEDKNRPWNMTTRTTTKIIPMDGYQNVELFHPSRQLHFHMKLAPYQCLENGAMCCDEPYMFEINPGIFYRCYTGNEDAVITFPSKYQFKHGEKSTCDYIPDYDMEAYPKEYLLHAYR